MAPAMKSLYFVCWALAAYVALSQGQTTPSPCDFPEICFPPVITFPEASDLEAATISARCYSACVEDVSNEFENHTFKLVCIYLLRLGCAPIHKRK